MHPRATLSFLILTLLAAPALAADDAAQSSLGRRIENFAAEDYRGKRVALADFADSSAVVVAFLGTDCPLARLYGPRLQQLSDEYADRGVAFIVVDSNRQDSMAEIESFARTRNMTMPVLKDTGNVIADLFGAERTPQAFLLDKQRAIRYVGRIDDQYGLGASSGYAQSEIHTRHLANALDELLAGKPVATPWTESPGCIIGRVRQANENADVTYSDQVARILQRNCVECHREGQIAPFALTDYAEVAGWADMIAEVVRDGRMPPWHADPAIGEFENDRSMSEVDKQALYAWAAAGAPEGDPAQLPEPIEYAEGWQYRVPDQIVYMADEPYDVPAEGTVRYQYFMVDPGWTDDQWVKSTECLLGNRSVVHHIFAFAVPPTHPLHKLSGHLPEGQEEGLLGDPQVRLIAGAAPGTPPMVGRDGMATRVVAGTKLLFQMHYTSNGAPQADRSGVGFTFVDPAEVTHSVEIGMAINPSFAIPPHADAHPVESAHRFSQDALLLNMTPHMHLRGKAFRYDLEYPDGQVETILSVPRYDFNWQVTYMLAEPKFVPSGTLMRCYALFDNSAENLANPNPEQEVHWGDQTWEEMMIGWFTQTTDIDPSQLGQDQTRTARFLKESGAKPPRLGRIAGRAAASALESPASMGRFLARIARDVPQVDRICVSVVDNGQLRVIRVAQPGVLEHPLGVEGMTMEADGSALARYAQGAEPVVHNDLAAEAQSDDLRRMARAVASSMHVPVTIDGRPALVSFWSKESGAFPDAAREYLADASRLVASGK